jgi:catecholate siderophore receptor
MSYIKSRKHPAAPRRHPTAAATAAALAAGIAMHPASAQTASGSTTSLPEITVSGDAQSDYKADALSSPKFTEPLIDTTRTVTIIKESLFKEQVATTLTEALRNTPGVGTFFLGENGNTTTGDAVYMRGFDASSSIFIDGVRDTSTASRDVFNIESIEVIKGPSGSDYGRTSPTGSINLVTKQPRLENYAAGTLSVGTQNQRRVTADLNRVIEGWNGAAFRLNVIKQDSDVPGRDHVNNDRLGIAPSLAFGLNGNTRAFFNFIHTKQNNVPDGGVPTIGLPGYSAPAAVAIPNNPTTANPGPLPGATQAELNRLNGAPRVRSRNFYGTSSDFDDATTNMLTARVEHDLGNGNLLTNTTRYGRTDHDYMLNAFMPTGNNLNLAGPQSAWTVARSLPTNVDQRNTILTNQTNLRATVTTGGLKHTLSTGLELTREEQINYAFVARNSGAAGTAPPANLYHPDSNAPGFNRIRWPGQSTGTTKTAAIYAFDTIQISDRFSVNGGLRYDRYKTEFASNPFTATATAPAFDVSKSGNLFGWKLGALYKPADNGSLYAAYGVSQQPPGGGAFALSTASNNANNTAYDPQKAKTAEVGTKWDFLDRQLGVAASLYRTEITNEIITDPISPTTFIQAGKKRVQGVELSTVGQITKAWAINAGYTTMHTAVTNGPNVGADPGSNALNYTPKSAFTLWTTYKTPFGLTIGGGARYNGKLQRGTDGAVGTPRYTDSYVVFDAMALYPINRNLSLQLNVYNLFDKDYVANINKSGYRYTPGVPRYALLSANFRF